MYSLVDADIIAYSVGFATDKMYYMVGKKKFKYHKTAKEWCMRVGHDLADIVKHHEPGDLDEALKSVDKLCNDIIDETGATDAQFYLTGSGNYRKDVAVTHVYKGNRSKKPHHIQAIREHLVDSWGAIIVEGQEADDALGIAQTTALKTGEESVICSTDKDLKMIPGWHYNWTKGGWEEVNELEGWRNFYAQLLMGDKTDHIFGIHGIGPKTAEKMLKDITTPEEMLCVVGTAYAVHFDDPEARMIENGQLLYIRKHEDEMWGLDYHAKKDT